MDEQNEREVNGSRGLREAIYTFRFETAAISNASLENAAHVLTFSQCLAVPS